VFSKASAKVVLFFELPKKQQKKMQFFYNFSIILTALFAIIPLSPYNIKASHLPCPGTFVVGQNVEGRTIYPNFLRSTSDLPLHFGE
jgi:hypothetical protein